MVVLFKRKKKEKAERRYLGGLRFEKYFDEVLWVEHREVFEILNLTRMRAFEVFEAFAEIDEDVSGEISVNEFHEWLAFKKTKFSARVFGILDSDGSGFLDFKEFLTGVWNWNTYDAALITKLAFSLFDVSKSGELELCEFDGMIRMIYGVDRADPDLLKKIDSNGDGKVSLEEFEELVEVHNYILQPAFDLQRALRRRICGVEYWEKESKRRRAYFSGYDAGAQSSWESIEKILSVKHKEQVERELREGALKEKEEKILKDADDNRTLRLKNEIANRRQKRAKLKNTETQEALAARRAEELLEDLELQMTSEEFIYADLFERRVPQRQDYWKAFDTYVEKQRHFLLTECDRKIKVAVGSDAEAKLDDYLSETDDGQLKFKREIDLNFAYDLHEKWADNFVSSKTKKKKDLLKKWLADYLLVDELGNGVYEATDLSRFIQKHFTSKAALALTRERAREAMLAAAKIKEEARVRAETRALVKAQEKAFAERLEESIGKHFSRTSKWERLWNGNHGAPYWFNYQTNESLWEKPHVCHNCDSAIDPNDAKCFACNSKRSPYNQRLYWDHTGTGPSRGTFDDDKKDYGDDDESIRKLRPQTNAEVQRPAIAPARHPPSGFLKKTMSSSRTWMTSFVRRGPNAMSSRRVLPGFLR